MTTMINTEVTPDLDTDTKSDLANLELQVLTTVTLPDLIRLGSRNTDQSKGWGDGESTACALTAAYLAARDLNLV